MIFLLAGLIQPAAAGFFDTLKKMFESVRASSTEEPTLSGDPLSDGFLMPQISSERDEAFSLALGAEGAIISPLIPFPDTGGPDRNSIVSYEIKEGDTISSIADEFGVSVNTIRWANNLSSTYLIKPGDKLVILPVKISAR